ncbi:MAG: hypothetical protein ABR540_19825 [Acidimicrobiales bacterium]
MTTVWRCADGDVRAPVDEAEWWGASLAVLVAAIHHPDVLAARQPDTDAADVARQVLRSIEELEAAAARAAEQRKLRNDDEEERPCSVRAQGGDVVFTPAEEVANLAFCLMVFARAVLEPQSPEASIARGATAYATSAWSDNIGKASGAFVRFEHPPDVPRERGGDLVPDGSDEAQDRAVRTVRPVGGSLERAL